MGDEPEKDQRIEITDSQIHALLAERGQIAVIWSVEDVQAVRPGLTEDQSWEVLQRVEHYHDCNYGITWDTLSLTADGLFRQPESLPEAEPGAGLDRSPAADRRQPWPSEIAEANRLKQAGQDHGKSGGEEPEHGHDDGHSM